MLFLWQKSLNTFRYPFSWSHSIWSVISIKWGSSGQDFLLRACSEVMKRGLFAWTEKRGNLPCSRLLWWWGPQIFLDMGWAGFSQLPVCTTPEAWCWMMGGPVNCQAIELNQGDGASYTQRILKLDYCHCEQDYFNNKRISHTINSLIVERPCKPVCVDSHYCQRAHMAKWKGQKNVISGEFLINCDRAN